MADLIQYEQQASALTQRQLETFLQDTRWEANDWRYVADREMDYYDNKQLDTEVLQLMEERGIPPLVRNLIGPAIDSVLGMEAKNRRDLRVVADSDDKEEQLAADALNQRFVEAQRVSRFARSTSDAYKGQVSVGVGWVHITRPLDPFEPPYRAESIHRREITWDMRGQRYDTTDWRYLVRKKWHDADHLKVIFPKHEKIIDNARFQWAGWDADAFVDAGGGLPLANAYTQWSTSALEAFEWLDTDRDRVALYEVWYRVYVRAKVFYIGSMCFEFDPKNEMHQAAVSSGRVRSEDTVISKVRLAYWLGPHQIMDLPSPFPHNRFPYVPFFGMREDRAGVPYGLIRRMMSPQDEVNARLSRMMWALSARRVVADSDAFDVSDQDVLDEVSRSDAFLKLNPNRKNRPSMPEIKTDHQLARDQFMVMQDATAYVKESFGAHGPFYGERQPGLDSGVAMQQLIEQSATTLNEINENYIHSRMLAAEQLVSLVKQDIGDVELPVTVQKGNKKVKVVLNGMQQDDEGNLYRTNNIAQIKTRIDIEEVPQTQSYRQQQYTQFAEVVKSAPPDVQPLLIDLLIKASDLPPQMREEAVARIRGHLGLSEDGDDGEFQEQQKQAQARAQQLAAEQQTAELQKTLAEVNKILAETKKIAAEIGVKQHEVSVKEDERQMRLDSHEREMQQPPENESQPAAATGGKAKGGKKAA